MEDALVTPGQRSGILEYMGVQIFLIRFPKEAVCRAVGAVQRDAETTAESPEIADTEGTHRCSYLPDI